MFGNALKKVKKIGGAVADAVETKYCIKKDGEVVAKDLNEEEVQDYLKTQLKIEIVEKD